MSKPIASPAPGSSKKGCRHAGALSLQQEGTQQSACPQLQNPTPVPQPGEGSELGTQPSPAAQTPSSPFLPPSCTPQSSPAQMCTYLPLSSGGLLEGAYCLPTPFDAGLISLPISAPYISMEFNCILPIGGCPSCKPALCQSKDVAQHQAPELCMHGRTPYVHYLGYLRSKK